jgi:DNA-binding NarL/FixJ family response regulator
MSNIGTQHPVNHLQKARDWPEHSSKASIRVLVIADIRLFREGLALVLSGCQRLTMVGAVRDRLAAGSASRSLAPDVALIDMATPESHQIVRDLRQPPLGTQVVALGVFEEEPTLLACVEAGVAGFVSRDGSIEDLIAAIETAARGDVICPPALVGPVWRRVAALAGNPSNQGVAVELTRREREIVRLIDGELSNKEIAKRLGIGLATVKNHVHNLLDKLHVATREQAAARVRFEPGPRRSESTT